MAPTNQQEGPGGSAELPEVQDASGRPKRKVVARAFGIAYELALCLLVVVVLTAAAGALTGKWHFEVVESGSMTPALRVGGVAVVVPEPVSAVRVGQILAFHPPKEPDYVRIHRVISVTHRGNQVWIRTKGDANNTADPGPVRLAGNTAYKETYFVPYVGYFGVWIYKHSTRVALEVVFFLLIVAGGLVLIWSKEDEDKAAEQASQVGVARSGRQRKVEASAIAGQAATASLVSLGRTYAATPDLSASAAAEAEKVAAHETLHEAPANEARAGSGR
jgi:signal peptidase